MTDVLRALLKSRKFTTMLMGVVVSILARVGLSPELAEPIVQIVMGGAGLYVLAQGGADFGKERAKAEAIPAPELPPESEAPK